MALFQYFNQKHGWSGNRQTTVHINLEIDLYLNITKIRNSEDLLSKTMLGWCLIQDINGSDSRFRLTNNSLYKLGNKKENDLKLNITKRRNIEDLPKTMLV